MVAPQKSAKENYYGGLLEQLGMSKLPGVAYKSVKCQVAHSCNSYGESLLQLQKYQVAHSCNSYGESLRQL